MNDAFFNLNTAKPDLRELIPAKVPLLVEYRYTPGGAGPDGALTQSKDSDAQYLKSEFTVLRGPFRGRKFWGNLTVSGGKVDEKGNSKAAAITRGHMRLMVESARGVSTKDESPEAAAKRVITSFKDLQGLRFVCTVKIEKGKDGYADKNQLGDVLTLDHKLYPRSEGDLDNPAIATSTAPAAPPAPVWGGTPAPQTAASQPAPTSVMVAAPAAPAPPQANDSSALPAWMKAAS